jgi:N-carbamoyl-L-amino-acid hydrolase
MCGFAVASISRGIGSHSIRRRSEVSSVVARLDQLSALGRYEGGIDRGLATPQERAAREHFAQWARGNGYALSQDRVGNLFARRAGTRSDAAPILTGSHLDTVKTGGAYDGAYGVVGALCALELLDARKIATGHPIEAVAWAGEEGSRFPLGCLGSAVFAGLTPADEALGLADEDGTSLRDALANDAGGLLRDVPHRSGSEVAAYVELHVEQGPILERAGVRLGIVTAIAAQRRFRVTLDGDSGHAGTVPMAGRSDALMAASEIILAIESTVRDLGEAVVTVGRMSVEPGSTNVIPARVTFSVDMRSPNDANVQAVEGSLHDAIARAKSSRGVRASLETLEGRKATPMTPRMREAVRRAAGSTGERSIDVPSGAGHDTMCVAAIAPVAMLFVPSIGGVSHVGVEKTSDADLELGVEALAAALVEVDRDLST